MTLATVQSAGPEQNGKYRQDNGNQQCGVTADSLYFLGSATHRGPGLGQGLELQGDIGQNGRGCHNGNQHRQRLALAVAGADIVSDRCDPMALTHRQQAPYQGPAEYKQQDGAQVDRRVAPGGSRGATDGPIKCPGAAVDGEGQCIDQPANPGRLKVDTKQPDELAGVTLAGGRPRYSIGVPGDAEQDANVDQREAEQVGGRHHGMELGRPLIDPQHSTGNQVAKFTPGSTDNCRLNPLSSFHKTTDLRPERSLP